MERVRTGIPNLDAILGGGLGRGDAVLVKGGPGAGKTALGLQWVCRGAIDFGEPGAIIVLEETPQQFYGRASAFGWDLRKLEEQNKVRTIFTSADALSQDILTGSLLVGMLAEIGARRVVIDPITNYRLSSLDDRQLRQKIYSTINALKRIGQTSLLLAELGPADREGPAPEEYMADAVISLGRPPGDLGHFRRLEVLKANAHDHRPRSALFRITPTGIHGSSRYPCPGAADPRETWEGLLDLYDDLGGLAQNHPGGTFGIFRLEAPLRRTLLDLALLTLLRPGGGTAVYLANSCVSLSDLWQTATAAGLSRSLQGEGDGGAKVYVLETFGRKCPPGFPTSRFLRLDGYDDRQMSLLCGEDDGEGKVALPAAGQGKSLIVCDLSDIFFYLGQARLQMLLPRLVDAARTAGVSVAGVVDPRLVTPEYRAWIEGVADGVVRLWEESDGRFARVVKSPRRQCFEPRLLVEQDSPPFFTLG